MQNAVLARNCSVFCPERDRCDRCDRFLHGNRKNKIESRQLHLAWDQGQTVSLQSVRRNTELLNRKDAKVAKKRNLLSFLLCFLLLLKRCEPKHAAPLNNTHITGRKHSAMNFLLKMTSSVGRSGTRTAHMIQMTRKRREDAKAAITNPFDHADGVTQDRLHEGERAIHPLIAQMATDLD